MLTLTNFLLDSAKTPDLAQERLKRLRALSSDSLSFTLISAIYYSLPTPYGWSYILLQQDNT